MLSAPITVEPPTVDVMELAALKLFLRIDGDELDGEVQDYLNAVVADVERMTSTRLADQVVELQADRFADLDHLTIGQVNEVAQVRYQNSAGAETILSADAYELFGAGLEKGIRPSFGHSWPATRSGSGVIAVQLAVGYGENLPPSIALALKQAVRSRFDGTAFDLSAATVNDRIWA